MKDLEIFELYNNSPSAKIDKFREKMDSNLNVKTDYDKLVCNYEWLEIMENTIRYLDNILRNPNRFIINEEEVVKIELARRVTVESIKHLARNTNFIQDIEDNGDVIPSKILNVNKDESYDTYENRFIYTLIVRMRSFIDIKKRDLVTKSYVKDTKEITYRATTNIGNESVNISVNMNSKSNTKIDDGEKDGMSITERIEKLEKDISALTNSETFKVLQKKHVALVMPPIKKTNVILKNTNFQYAMKLWNFLQEHLNDGNKREKEKKNYDDNGELKRYSDDCFLLEYLLLNTLSKEEKDEEMDSDTVEQITNALIEKIVNLNADMSEDKLKDMIGEKLLITKQNNLASLREIQNGFTKYIDQFLDKIKDFEF